MYKVQKQSRKHKVPRVTGEMETHSQSQQQWPQHPCGVATRWALKICLAWVREVPVLPSGHKNSQEPTQGLMILSPLRNHQTTSCLSVYDALVCLRLVGTWWSLTQLLAKANPTVHCSVARLIWDHLLVASQSRFNTVLSLTASFLLLLLNCSK